MAKLAIDSASLDCAVIIFLFGEKCGLLTKSVIITYFCVNTRVYAVPVILIILQILVEMCLYGACKLMNSLINNILTMLK